MIQKRYRQYNPGSNYPNIIVIDWRERSMNAFTNKVAANSRIVAAEANYLLERFLKINENFVKPDRSHYVGHYFGAQVVGLLM